MHLVAVLGVQCRRCAGKVDRGLDAVASARVDVLIVIIYAKVCLAFPGRWQVGYQRLGNVNQGQETSSVQKAEDNSGPNDTYIMIQYTVLYTIDKLILLDNSHIP